MTKRLISLAEFSRQAGVSRAAVTKAASGALKAAVSGTSIDIDHPDAVNYIRAKQRKAAPPPTEKPPKAPRVKKPPAVEAPPPPQGPHYSKDKGIERVLGMTLGDLIKEFGTDEQFKKWVDATKTITEIRHKTLKIAEDEKLTIPKDIVKTHIFGAIEAMNLRLLTDAPKKLSRMLYAAAKSGAALEEGEQIIRDEIGKQLKNSKATAMRMLGR